jgi:hypothetical protein
MNSRARRAATLTTGAGAVLTFVALLIPQVADALSLTTPGKVLAAVGIGLLTACGQRLVSFRRARAAVQAALRVWPPEPLGSARLSTLGVFPAHDGQGRRVRYQPRPNGEDGALADALRTARTVIVHGPAGCGKSRAVSHAAAAELPDVPAVIPLDAPSLHSLLDGGVDLPLSHHELCLWLDGLDRFTEVLDPCSVESAQTASSPSARIVATLRTDEWTALVTGAGQNSEAARARAGCPRHRALGIHARRAGRRRRRHSAAGGGHARTAARSALPRAPGRPARGDRHRRDPDRQGRHRQPPVDQQPDRADHA